MDKLEWSKILGCINDTEMWMVNKNQPKRQGEWTKKLDVIFDALFDWIHYITLQPSSWYSNGWRRKKHVYEEEKGKI